MPKASSRPNTPPDAPTVGYRRAVHAAEHDELRDRRADHADQVIDEEALRPEQALDLAAEHVQRQHVEQQVRQAAVQEAVGDELPDLEAGDAAELRRAERPQRERARSAGCR